MAKKTVEETHEKKERAALEVNPRAVREGGQLVIRGSGWEDCPIELEIDGKSVRINRIAQGFPALTGVRPDATGNFVVSITTRGLKLGNHKMFATLTHPTRKLSASALFEIAERPQFKPNGRVAEPAYWRALDFFNRRFGHIGFVPPGVRETQISQVRLLRENRDKASRRAGLIEELFGHGLSRLEPDMPNPAVCNWNPVGAGPVPKAQTEGTPTQPVSGRTLAIAIDAVTPSTVYIGTAGAGVWKSIDSGVTWSPKTDYLRSLAIGALAIDPNNASRIFAGTGEYHHTTVGGLTYYGNGILQSIDGGDTWTELATAIFQRDEISQILFDTTDPTSQRMFLSSATGAYESTDGGVNWTQLRAGSVSDLVMIVNAGPPVTVQLIAAFNGSGLWTSTRTGSTWSTWTQMTSATFPVSFARIALGQSRQNSQTIYVAFSDGSGLAGMAKTTDGGATWTSVSGPASPSGQTWYNFHISVHPTNPNTVYYGEVRLWRTTTGNAPWTDITDGEPVGPPPAGTPIGIHVDQHAFAFDPVNPTIIWAGNDGGVYRSTDAGAIWTHRNRDLGTLQYMHISLHPQWEAVMLGGTQDNGTHRYSGNPAWEFSDYGDGGFTAIDPNNPTRMYHGYVYNYFYRSDNAGGKGTWVSKTGTISGSAEFYPPFTLDPSNPNVCYFGNNQLWRSSNNADTWSAITNALTGNATAIAVHPTDSNTIYVGTTAGRVYRVQRTGATWALADVTTTDLTGLNLPANVYISDLAVDTAGTVWVTIASVLWTESSGEFTNNHVYRRTVAGTTWETRSNGLVQANPINTIVIDPTNNNRLFCGGDVGIFRTEDAGGTWIAWDEGLPNVPVFHLAIHGPRRLLRAATHGRSVWERPIDTATCPMVDLYLRDNILDTGRVQPTPSGQPHPFAPSTQVYWWQSVDVKVDGPEPNYQTPAPITDYVAFESDLQHRQTRRNRVNRFYVQIHNRGVSKATNVQVRAFFANASAGLPPLPADFWSAGKPFNADPSSANWTPIGPTRSISVLEAAEPAVVEWDWLVPNSAAQHSCLLALATCTEDPLNGAGIFDVGTLVTTRKQVTLKNLHVSDPVPGIPLPPEQVFMLELHNPLREKARFELMFRWGTLPRETSLYVAFERPIHGEPAVLLEAKDFQHFGLKINDDVATLFPNEQEFGCGDIRRFECGRVFQLSPLPNGTTIIPGVLVPPDRPLTIAINLVLPGDTGEEAVQFDVIQQSGNRIVGGGTYLLRPQKQKT